MSRSVFQNVRPAISPQAIISSSCIYSHSLVLSSETSMSPMLRLLICAACDRSEAYACTRTSK